MDRSPDLMVGFDSKGSACCVWTTALASYVLTAAHVLDSAPPFTPIRWLSFDQSSSGRGSAQTDLLWPPMPGGDLDGGVVEIDEAGPFRVGGPYPGGRGILPWHGIGDGLIVRIGGKHGLETAEFHRKLDAGKPFGHHLHGRLIEFRLLPGSLTDPGDSGAAVTSLPEGMLVGMHIASFERSGARFTLAVAAEDIRDTFSVLLPGFELRP